jgi:hypothetical protein
VRAQHGQECCCKQCDMRNSEHNTRNVRNECDECGNTTSAKRVQDVFADLPRGVTTSAQHRAHDSADTTRRATCKAHVPVIACRINRWLEQAHEERLDVVLSLLRKHQLYAEQSKCNSQTLKRYCQRTDSSMWGGVCRYQNPADQCPSAEYPKPRPALYRHQ